MSRQQFRNARMSLFVGNISRLVEQKDIEREFRAYGDCTVDFRVKNNDRYAFIQYKSEQEAEAAKNALHQRDLQGLRINVEWSKKSGRYDENREPRRERGKDDRGGYEICLIFDNQGEITTDLKEITEKRTENKEEESNFHNYKVVLKVEAEAEAQKIEAVPYIVFQDPRALTVIMSHLEIRCEIHSLFILLLDSERSLKK